MRTESAFSLVEVMCAILILGIGVAGISQGITTALGSNKDAEVQTAAALLAAGQIEELRADGYLIAGESEGEGDGALSGYTWVRNVVDSQPEGLYEVTVTIRKTAANEDVFELKTLLFDPPIVRDPEEDDRSGKKPDSTRRGTR